MTTFSYFIYNWVFICEDPFPSICGRFCVATLFLFHPPPLHCEKPFSQQCMDIQTKVCCTIYPTQPKTVLGIHRADYLLDYRKGTSQMDCQLGIKQVEVNTVSASFGGVSQGQIQNFHQWVYAESILKRQALLIIQWNLSNLAIIASLSTWYKAAK